MRKGHYGHYTGNARHSRKEEMIHDREMIYDAKTQIHNEDKKYRETGKDAYKQDMIHERELIHDTKGQLHKADSDYKGSSPAHISYSSKFGSINLKDPESTGAYANFDGGAAGEISAMKQKAAGFNRALDQVTNATVDKINEDKGKPSSVETSVDEDVTGKKAAKDYFGGQTASIKTDFEGLGRRGDLSLRTLKPRKEIYKYSDMANDMKAAGKSQSAIDIAIKKARKTNLDNFGTHTPTYEGFTNNYKS